MSPAAGPLPAEDFERLIAAHATEFGVSISPQARKRLGLFLAELEHWRRRTNLTGRLSSEDLVSHTLESALGAGLIADAARVLDIGSGAGFPGVPIAIVRDDLRLTLLEPRAKRAVFLKHVVSAVPLGNAAVVQKRLEMAGFPAGTFDCIVERAVGDLGGLIGGASFLKPGGAILAWTTASEALQRELPAFARGRTITVPGSRRKVITEFVFRH